MPTIVVENTDTNQKVHLVNKLNATQSKVSAHFVFV